MGNTMRRLGSLLLLTVFIGGGFGLSDVDALLFHSGFPPSTAETGHVDLPGGCGAHSERCVLSNAASMLQLAPLGVATTVVAATSECDSFISVPALRSADRSLLQPARAPPAPAS